MNLLLGHDADVLDWYCVKRLCNERADVAIGILEDNTLRGAVTLFFENDTTASMGAYSELRSWAPVARQLCNTLFLLCWRVTIRTEKSNKLVKRHAPRLGFRFDGTRRDYYGPGADALEYYMTAETCRWINGQQTQSARAA